MKKPDAVPRAGHRLGLIALCAVVGLAAVAAIYIRGSALLGTSPGGSPTPGSQADPSATPAITAAPDRPLAVAPAATDSVSPTRQPARLTDAPTPYLGVLNRPADPIVLTGKDVPWFPGIGPDELVAWRYDAGWQQVPVQVDERAVLDLGRVSRVRLDQSEQTRSQVLLYTDPSTLTGPDPDITLDADDEIVFMARDVGRKAPSGLGEPPGIIPNSGIEVAVFDPLDGRQGYLYLFRQDGTLDPGAGQSYVNYRFNLLSGDYTTTYQFERGANPENSVINTAYYRDHFADRWVHDELHILAGGASEVDILDRHKTQLGPGNCARTEDTFSTGGGGFVANKSGPVRAIRSYIGANSGRLTQRTHFFYDRRQDIVSNVRVHQIPGLLDLFDYSPEAAGMVYANNLNPAGVTIDGLPDQVITGTLEWEMVSGAQGGLVIVHRIETDLPAVSIASYYLDDADRRSNRALRCTGDEYAYGASGPWWTSALASTNTIRSSEASSLVMTRILYYEAPGLSIMQAEALDAGARTPLGYATRPWRQEAP